MSRLTLVLSTVLAATAAFGIAFVIARERSAPKGRMADVTGERALASSRAPAAASAGLPVMWAMPAFSFRDQDDRPASAADLRGHVVIADFVFTTCTTICPLITAKMALLQRRLPSEKLRFVSFSVDPARDTPEALKRYAMSWRPGESRWILLSTTPAGLESLASKMFVSVKPAENDIAHSNLFFLVDEQGGVRGIYESDRNDALERLVQDTNKLLGDPPDAPSSPGAPKGSELYAALGCGACHARKELAPPLEKLLGRPVVLQGGGTITADAAYIRESIVAPDAKLVAGSVLRMPSYEKDLTPAELDALVGYVQSLIAPPNVAKPAAASTAPPAGSAMPAAASTATAAASAEPEKPSESSFVAFDPVCSMSVRVVESTPRASHAGRTFYFCSEMCREKFTAEPARYAK